MNIAEQVAAVPFWYHKIDLGNNVITPGWAPHDESMYKVPPDMTGRRVLDCGAWDGFWTFKAIRQGAEFVQAIDDFSDTLGNYANVDRAPAWQTFDLCAEALQVSQDRFCRQEMSVYDVASLGMQFDHIFCFGLLYHLRHPLLALDVLRSVCKGTIHIETAILDNCKSAYVDFGYDGDEQSLEFYPHSEYGSNPSNWWVGTLKCWHAMVEAAGFKNVTSWKLTDTPRSLSESRGFVTAEI